MNYINEKLLKEHLQVIEYINETIEDAKGSAEEELYKLIVQRPEHIYQVFGSGYYSLTLISSLIASLKHWITDDGDYSIVRKVNKLRYDYSIQAGYGRDEDESCYTTVEDMIYLFNAYIETSAFYESNKDSIEGFVSWGREPYIGRRKKPCYQQWRMLEDRADKYLEKKFNERWEK